MQKHPKYPLPAPLHGLEPESLAEEAITIRFPKIGRTVLTDNDLPPKAVRAMEKLLIEIPHGAIQPLSDDAPDAASWNSALEPYLGKNWLEPPWFVVETYFYRRIVAAIDYFKTGKDPFAIQKERVLHQTTTEIHALSTRLQKLTDEGWNDSHFDTLLEVDLWGNQVDLSLWSAEDRPQHGESVAEDFLLVDGREQIDTYLQSIGSDSLRLDIIIDNAAFELIGDLCLADYLLSSDRALQVCFHLKIHPTFVSDATINDVNQTIRFLETDDHHPTRAMGSRLTNHLNSGRLQCLEHSFWTSLHYMWHMPEDVRRDLASSHLVISKGDANYRRALGDVHWPHDTPIDEIVSYFPAPILFLRTCKSDLIAGLKAGQANAISEQDPQWLSNGKWGLIQYVG